MSIQLAPAVTDVLRLLTDPREVSAALHRICAPSRDVFSTFNQAVDIVVAFTSRNGTDAELRRRELHELRAMAREMINALREAIPADVLSADMAKDVALKDLLGRM